MQLAKLSKDGLMMMEVDATKYNKAFEKAKAKFAAAGIEIVKPETLPGVASAAAMVSTAETVYVIDRERAIGSCRGFGVTVAPMWRDQIKAQQAMVMHANAAKDLERERTRGTPDKRKAPRRRRNAICDCGSGRKFKRCCR